MSEDGAGGGERLWVAQRFTCHPPGVAAAAPSAVQISMARRQGRAKRKRKRLLPACHHAAAGMLPGIPHPRYSLREVKREQN